MLNYFRFLRGEERQHIDYSLIDDNEIYDDERVINQDAEDSYFAVGNDSDVDGSERCDVVGNDNVDEAPQLDYDADVFGDTTMM